MNNILLYFDYFFPSYKAGGPVKSGLSIYKILEDLNADFLIVTRNSDIDSSELDPRNKLSKVIYSNHSFIPGFRQVLSAKIIVLNSLFSVKFSIVPLILSIVFGKKLYLFTRGEILASALRMGKSNFKRIYLGVLKLNRKLTLFVTSEEERAMAHEHFPKNTILLFPNFRQDLIGSENRYDPLASKEFDFGIIGRIAKIKNQLGIITALQNVNCSLLVKGPPEDLEYTKICQNVNAQNIKIEPFAEPDVNDFFSRIKVLIIPSLSENYCHVFYEALAYGLPVLISEGVNQSFYLQDMVFSQDEILEKVIETNMLKSEDLKCLSEKLHSLGQKELVSQLKQAENIFINSNFINDV